MKLYNYGGTISKNLLITNTANIKLVDFANSLIGHCLMILKKVF